MIFFFSHLPTPPILFFIIYCTIQVWHDASEYVNTVHDNKLENGATGVEFNAMCACLCHPWLFWNLWVHLEVLSIAACKMLSELFMWKLASLTMVTFWQQVLGTVLDVQFTIKLALRASLSGTSFQTARFSYATEGVCFISTQLSTDAVSAL